MVGKYLVVNSRVKVRLILTVPVSSKGINHSACQTRRHIYIYRCKRKQSSIPNSELTVTVRESEREREREQKKRKSEASAGTVLTVTSCWNLLTVKVNTWWRKRERTIFVCLLGNKKLERERERESDVLEVTYGNITTKRLSSLSKSPSGQTSKPKGKPSQTGKTGRKTTVTERMKQHDSEERKRERGRKEEGRERKRKESQTR